MKRRNKFILLLLIDNRHHNPFRDQCQNYAEIYKYCINEIEKYGFEINHEINMKAYSFKNGLMSDKELLNYTLKVELLSYFNELTEGEIFDYVRIRSMQINYNRNWKIVHQPFPFKIGEI